VVPLRARSGDTHNRTGQGGPGPEAEPAEMGVSIRLPQVQNNPSGGIPSGRSRPGSGWELGFGATRLGSPRRSVLRPPHHAAIDPSDGGP
jgi:hypothetical protein